MPARPPSYSSHGQTAGQQRVLSQSMNIITFDSWQASAPAWSKRFNIRIYHPARSSLPTCAHGIKVLRCSSQTNYHIIENELIGDLRRVLCIAVVEVACDTFLGVSKDVGELAVQIATKPTKHLWTCEVHNHTRYHCHPHPYSSCYIRRQGLSSRMVSANVHFIDLPAQLQYSPRGPATRKPASGLPLFIAAPTALIHQG